MKRPAPTPEMAEQIAKTIRAGSPRGVAAQIAGISESTLDHWIQDGRALQDGQTLDDPCPTCGAVGTEKCITASGTRSAQVHAGRAPIQAERHDDLLHLLQVIETAEAAAHAESVALIRRAARDGTWQAAAWFLERRYPQQYGRFTRTEVTGADGGPVQVEGLGDGVSDEQLAALLTRDVPAVDDD